ncbi:PREDICTED: LOC109950252 [Prunus dulcis]|uniref:PREDICTED: LOC109950252 n=1 Tax=Prunus dulcis TaxID=3755 RepID=A0A5E4F3A7_PRUDU|nr:PREDICTED: LOC109950252 [Prunus dulcis]
MRRRELLICSFSILCLLARSTCESAFTPTTGDSGPLKQHDQLKVKDIHEMTTRSSRKSLERPYGRMHQVHHLRTSQKARAIYGGASDLKRPRTNHNAASCVPVKPTLALFLSALAMLIFSL